MTGIKTRCTKHGDILVAATILWQVFFLTIPVLLVGKGKLSPQLTCDFLLNPNVNHRGGRLEKLDTIFRAKTGEFLGCWWPLLGNLPADLPTRKQQRHVYFYVFLWYQYNIQYIYTYHFKSITSNVCHSLICSQFFCWIFIPKMFTSKVLAKGVSCLRQGRNIWHRAFLACVFLFKLVPLQIEWMCPSLKFFSCI